MGDFGAGVDQFIGNHVTSARTAAHGLGRFEPATCLVELLSITVLARCSKVQQKLRSNLLEILDLQTHTPTQKVSSPALQQCMHSAMSPYQITAPPSPEPRPFATRGRHIPLEILRPAQPPPLQ